MKHLIPKEHHPHLKNRFILELFGLIVLILISINQWDLIKVALNGIRNSDILYIIILFSMYWLILPLTAISYQKLSRKKIPFISTTLAQLAAAGPGRIIPGGLGHISIGAMHLHNLGFSIHRALAIPVANNVIGLVTNSILVLIAVIYHPTLIETLVSNISVTTVTVSLIIILIIASFIMWLSHARKTRKQIKKFNKQWKILLSYLIKNPNRLLIVIVISLFITAGHVLMLILAGKALYFDISATDALLALSVGILMGGALPTPGGVGAVEAGSISALIILGYEPAQATSAALLYRAATYWQPLIPGMISYLYLRERKLL